MRLAVSALVEIVVLLVVATGLALGFNSVRSEGLSLSRDYFKTAPSRAPQAHVPVSNDDRNDQPALADLSPPADPDAEADSGQRDHGYQTITFDRAVVILDDPGYQDGICIFVDARDNAHYLDGHVPGAYQLNHYLSQQFLPQLVPIALAAEKVVIYCNGGDCEDSLFAAVDLLDEGVPYESLYLYEGGMDEWRKRGGPIEEGARTE